VTRALHITRVLVYKYNRQKCFKNQNIFPMLLVEAIPREMLPEFASITTVEIVCTSRSFRHPRYSFLDVAYVTFEAQGLGMLKIDLLRYIKKVNSLF
jgi:hypothetical protein